jgi:hypothetical protein
MGLFSWIRPGNDHELAATQYAGRESATERAARIRREKHRSGSAAKAARRGQKWDVKDRQQDRKGPWYQAAR